MPTLISMTDPFVNKVEGKTLTLEYEYDLCDYFEFNLKITAPTAIFEVALQAKPPTITADDFRVNDGQIFFMITRNTLQCAGKVINFELKIVEEDYLAFGKFIEDYKKASLYSAKKTVNVETEAEIEILL